MGNTYKEIYDIKYQFNWYQWYKDNCCKCKFSNMKEYMKNEYDTGLCFAELDQHILSNKPRLMHYIGIIYHKNRKENGDHHCELREILHGECEFRGV